ncbi:pyruvate dehydrogenase protein x component [Stachybotrys elegans]|uniref:Pyruvate dehydrogenase protein x component n=1 Tax=Stachybotrys elegans TaxID=80388 RepID=A0A8K0WWD0_9HYPO|nr:pyruvate dehydrogenase protein x component [Stachybotrys elegans]
MPALSPTMTEGNIATWKVKEGESFSAGDVLLEIETDKATMDVEAQEDGIMMKIMAQDGSKSVQVGTRIAVVAEAGDDIGALEIPADEQPKQAAEAPAQESSSPKTSEVKSSEPNKTAKSSAGSGTYEHKYPLLPSVGHLVKQHGLSEQDVSKIKGTGPNGRLLKGDVLAYMGAINSETPASLSSYFEKLSHLDLSNIKVAAPKAPAAPKVDKPAAPKAPVKEIVEIQVPISMENVLHVQKKIQKSIGTFLPLSTFFGRAAAVANDDLPPVLREPTPSELFDSLLGLDKAKGYTGSPAPYLPEISAVTPASFAPARPAKKADIIDILAGPAKKPARPTGIPTVPGFSNGINVFSLAVPKAEEQRAQVFLERCKQILEEEPGRLVL